MCDEIKIRNSDIPLFVDCESAIVSAFGISIPKYQVDIILNIRRLTSHLENGNNNLNKESEGYNRADRLAKEVAKEMEGKMKNSMRE